MSNLPFSSIFQVDYWRLVKKLWDIFKTIVYAGMIILLWNKNPHVQIFCNQRSLEEQTPVIRYLEHIFIPVLINAPLCVWIIRRIPSNVNSARIFLSWPESHGLEIGLNNWSNFISLALWIIILREIFAFIIDPQCMWYMLETWHMNNAYSISSREVPCLFTAAWNLGLSTGLLAFPSSVWRKVLSLLLMRIFSSLTTWNPEVLISAWAIRQLDT